MDTAQTIIRAILDEQRRTGAQLHKAAQRASRQASEIRALRRQAAQREETDATVQRRVAEAFERMTFALTGHSATPDAAYAHDLFENWDERWGVIAERAMDLRNAETGIDDWWIWAGRFLPDGLKLSRDDEKARALLGDLLSIVERPA